MLKPGQIFETRRLLTQADFNSFAELSGDDNPIHVDPIFAATTHFGGTVSHGMLLYSCLSGAIQQHVPGARQLSHDMMFPTGTLAGEEIIVRMTVAEVDTEAREALLDVATIRPNGAAGLQGQTRIKLAEDKP
ncbi:MAG: hypothetical protein JSS58_02320 [Proteobacteria bacterium]|nr:hypothetical protein [Pseudomonadota bacterium]